VIASEDTAVGASIDLKRNSDFSYVEDCVAGGKSGAGGAMNARRTLEAR